MIHFLSMSNLYLPIFLLISNSSLLGYFHYSFVKFRACLDVPSLSWTEGNLLKSRLQKQRGSAA